MKEIIKNKFGLKIDQMDIDIVYGLSYGKRTDVMGKAFKISKRTVEHRIGRLLLITATTSSPQLVAFFLRNKLIK